MIISSTILQRVQIMARVNALSKGSTFREISLEELRKVKVLCPPFCEQRKIAKILYTWDEAIATTEQLLTNSEHQKKVLMQQLLQEAVAWRGSGIQPPLVGLLRSISQRLYLSLVSQLMAIPFMALMDGLVFTVNTTTSTSRLLLRAEAVPVELLTGRNENHG